MSNSIIRDSFKDSVSKRFKEIEKSEMTETEIKAFVNYLIEHKIIPNVAIKIYTILAEFEKVISIHPEKNKSECVALLNAKLNLNTSTIWNILKDHKGKFNFN